MPAKPRRCVVVPALRLDERSQTAPSLDEIYTPEVLSLKNLASKVAHLKWKVWKPTLAFRVPPLLSGQVLPCLPHLHNQRGGLNTTFLLVLGHVTGNL